MVDYFEHSRRMDNIRAEEAAGNVADSMDVRLAIIARIKSGEITLAQGQAELKRIQRGAKARGQITRNNAYTGRDQRPAQGTSVRMDQDPQGLEAKPAGPVAKGHAPEHQSPQNHLQHKG